jgi:hypothetical protein
MLNDADEMRLFGPTTSDAPFGPHDLEWLYRDQDVDGGSLDSRLARLAPLSFTNPVDGLTRRRMFSVDSWDVNSVGNAFGFVNYTYTPLNVNASVLPPASRPLPFSLSVAHRDRRINLNFPLPNQAPAGVSMSNEPVRVKWVQETYGVLRQVLALSMTTPAQYAALSQYILNIVDFRDTDDVMTHWVNPDVLYVPPIGTAQSYLIFGNNTTDPGYSKALPLDQYGMEYNPIALNEVLAYQFQYLNLGKAATAQRMFIELVNTLTQDGNPTATPGGSLASDLALTGWDLSIMPDDVTGRPDPNTGQIPQLTAALPVPTELYPIDLTAAMPTAVQALDPTAGTARTSYFYVIANAPIAGAELTPPMAESTALPMTFLPPALAPGSGATKYYWLYLRRPADPNTAGSPMVVVDSFRFPYSDGGINGTVVGGMPQTAAGGATPELYSLQRLQPYRGGQAIPPLTGGATLDPHYGYSEQAAPPLGAGIPVSPTPNPAPNGSPTDTVGPAYAGGGNTWYAWYGRFGTLASTKVIVSTLGAPNLPNDSATGWDYFPFHDRDFQSVAELLLVPGWPPGLFTKQFVETTPDLLQTFVITPFMTPPVLRPTGSNAGMPFPTAVAPPPPPQVYPYLVDRFFYSAPGVGDSWHMMLDYFEVPSPAFGSIGEVAAGANGDWYRQDLRPGMINLNLIIDEEVFFGLIDDPRLNFNVVVPGAPNIATQSDANGNTNASYGMRNRGFLNAGGVSTMKPAFADFLRLRGSGTNTLYVSGYGGVTERPYRALSNSDITTTVMRPYGPLAALAARNTGVPLPSGITPPQTPPRRLFQLPDATVNSNAGKSPSSTAPYQYNHPAYTNTVLSNTFSNLFFDDTSGGTNANLGANSAGTVTDNRQHPYYRSELLQKIMNLTTPRTQQFAVWVTVGFFEVVKPGNPQMGRIDPRLVMDQLGQEVGKSTGKNVRFREFFILDRTRATGFNPRNPGDFRDLIIYRRRIE